MLYQKVKKGKGKFKSLFRRKKPILLDDKTLLLTSGKYIISNIEKEVFYYHSCVSDFEFKTMKPSGYYEKVLGESGCPQPLFNDIRADMDNKRVKALRMGNN